MRLPEQFISRMQRELGVAEAEALCAALETEPSTSVRLNPAKMAEQKWGGGRVAWSDYGYLLGERPAFTLDPDFHAGAYYVQEASSQFAGYIVSMAVGGAEACKGLRVLDMCAAPGGKSTHYATLVGERGLVVANEINRNRAAVLADNARKWGLGNMVVTCNDSARVADFEEWFDVVAVDAPCSGEGMFRKSDEACEQWSEANVAMCAERQWEILQNAFRSLKPGGVLLYSTCTFNRTEDEDVVGRACEEFGDELLAVDDIPIGDDWGVVTGREGVFQTFRFFPHRLTGEGMFMAVARKAGLATSRRRMPKARRKVMEAVDKRTVQELSRWVKESEQMRFFAAGDTLYGCRKEHYDEVEALAGTLAVIYSGVAMGQVFKGKLKPDGALALYAGVNHDAVACCEVDEQEALKFLRKQDMDAAQFSEGVNMVLYGGRPLGFVKRVGARVNNMYPNSLRILK
ncbi:MAG: rRNA cytosine-C5-methylase [Rikenellaceae bacterium]|nr:rRNA cytosine-C5-methylase [Rikenellaceae bacterium]